MDSSATIQPVTLRPATAADQDLCFRIHTLAMQPLVTTIWGWDEDVQRSMFARSWDESDLQIVLVDGVPSGMLRLSERTCGEGHKDEKELYIGTIELVPSVQGHGVGTRLLNDAMEQAMKKRMNLALEVWTQNASARKLYSRLGFKETGQVGLKICMRWQGEGEAERSDRLDMPP